MDMSEARSFKDGIDFHAKTSNGFITIRARREEDGQISVERIPGVESFNEKYSIINIAIGLITVLMNALLSHYLKPLANEMYYCGIILLAWGIAFMYYFVSKINTNNASMYRYHAAEHKLLNYYDKYKKAPETVDDIRKMSSISIRCGSTIIMVAMIFFTLIALSVIFFKSIWIRIPLIILSAILTIYLWGKEKCYTFQKMVLKEPTINELEVALLGMKEYVKVIKENTK